MGHSDIPNLKWMMTGGTAFICPILASQFCQDAGPELRDLYAARIAAQLAATENAFALGFWVSMFDFVFFAMFYGMMYGV